MDLFWFELGSEMLSPEITNRRFCPRSRAEAVENSFNVPVHRPRAEAKRAGDFLVGKSAAQQRQHVAFTQRQSAGAADFRGSHFPVRGSAGRKQPPEVTADARQ